MPLGNFDASDANELAAALEAEGVDYLVVGQGAAILVGFPGTTQDVDLFLPRSRENSRALIRALHRLGFPLEPVHLIPILAGSEMVILRGGPFALDLFHALDGLESFEAAKARSIVSSSRLRVLSIDDVILTKSAAGRAKDLATLPMLDSFRRIYKAQKEVGEADL